MPFDMSLINKYITMTKHSVFLSVLEHSKGQNGNTDSYQHWIIKKYLIQ